MSSSEYYDNFINYQVETGINDRIYGLYRKLCKTGLNADYDILEIGCGIGSLTYLLSRKVKRGTIEATDISPRSIDYAKKYIDKPNVLFSSSDILNYTPKCKTFDRILLFDILEHIDEGKHYSLFSKITSWMNENSLLLINIPNPMYILYDRKNNPQALQETDLPVFTGKLAYVLDSASLDIMHLETYSVWAKDDYIFLTVKKRKDFVKKVLNDERNFLKKLLVRLGREYRNLTYRYPR